MGGQDPFGKLKSLISDMISRLEQEADADATQKAYCDKEMGETAAKADEKNAEISKLTTKIDSESARSAQLKAQVAELQSSLAALAKTQVEMNTLREEEKTEFTAA